MIELRETFRVDRDIEEAFRYIADFRNTVEWDATAQTAQKLTEGPVGAGTRFALNCALPLGSLDIDYSIESLAPPTRLVLNGHSRLFRIRDAITLQEEQGQLRVDYCATFEPAALLRPFAPAMRAGMTRMGRASAEGLHRALADDFPPPPAEPEAISLARRLTGFTRRGYTRARRDWHPMSASLAGRHALVTGATSGLGAVIAEQLARRGAKLTLVARDPRKAERGRRRIVAETGNKDVHVELADLAELAQVDALAARLADRGEPLHILVNNAGALFPEHALTSEGFERSIALLLLSPYRLTLGLQPLLASAGSARVVNVVSGGMYTQRLSLAQLQDTSDDNYSGPVAYAQAKRALSIVTGHWAGQWHDQGIVVNAMHPGWVDTPGLATSLPGFHKLTRCALRTPEQGADTAVWLAAATEADQLSGHLFLDRQVQPLHLKRSTEESAADRAALLDWLRRFDPCEDGAPINEELRAS
ncbi:SDR family NAD(P)-dependent oxidoreductase [Mangrovimicrobium sediminis]|uniref:SDR family NAD(P)-dependent oxidoreductase n=1 Tax=Mangrovimicrobium sediminis TaxID=2562682 RepID=A0A4Z0M5T8_9GAMM|nr:SDR family NAD(P)-dependent oxidoreductase [Haliea sp. SAOS-164]TGD74806.1 SDR family NAD(P)-dependent oxidoreductase [Haliea sp. SAOS-164]